MNFGYDNNETVYSQDDINQIIHDIVHQFDLEPDTDIPELARILGVEIPKREFHAEINLRLKIKTWTRDNAEDALGELERALDAALSDYTCGDPQQPLEVTGWIGNLID